MKVWKVLHGVRLVSGAVTGSGGRALEQPALA